VNQQVNFQTDIQDDCWIKVDPQKLNQSLLNILKNAVEAMPNGGTVSLSCHQTDDGGITLTIKDLGIGMNQKQGQRHGSPYYSLK
jgi:two-component system, sporulation sensor kinase B